MFLPTTQEEMRARGWERADVVLVSGDAYVDSPYSGVAVIGQVLARRGFRVAVLSQPDARDPRAFRALGEPALFWGVSAGCVDSMVANYTATGRRRRQDDFTPGGANDRRPDRATIVYANAIRAAFHPAKPIVLGGVEASLRRVAHYDFWSDKVRRPVLCDAKADALCYGMGERAMTALAEALRDGADWRGVRGLCYLADDARRRALPGAIELPSFADVAAKTDAGRRAFLRAHVLFAANQDAATARPLVQKVDLRWLVHNPPAPPLEPDELDAVHDIPFMLDAPPSLRAQGPIRALDTIRFSVTTHRGCYGNCRFCAIAVHQGRRVVSRSPRSILAEVARFAEHPKFRGVVADVGGPTANMYGFDCPRKKAHGACPARDCLFPAACPSLRPDHRPQLDLLRRIRALPGVRHVFVASGIRPDLVAADPRSGRAYVDALARHHVSGQLKLAPEHAVDRVLAAMGKPGVASLLRFKEAFDAASRACGKRQFLTYYFIAAHPGCTERDMQELRRFATRHLHLSPEQVQIFTPTPLTAATAMYYTGLDPATGAPVFVERGLAGKQRQKDVLTGGARPARAGAWRARVAAAALALAGTLASAVLESPPVSRDDIRWKTFRPASEVYIDTTLQFTPAFDATPGVDRARDKLALWLNVDTSATPPATNLCVYAARADLAPAPTAARRAGLRLGARGAVTATSPQIFRLRGTETLEAGRWYRLTVRTIKDVTQRAARTGVAAHGLLGFQIYLDGALLSSGEPSFSPAYAAYATGTEGWLDAARDAELLAFLRSGTVFVSLRGETADDAVESVGFRGEGAFDDVDVSAEAPTFLGLSSLDFTLALPPGESVVSDLLHAE